jgi:hypothetical protein
MPRTRSKRTVTPSSSQQLFWTLFVAVAVAVFALEQSVRSRAQAGAGLAGAPALTVRDESPIGAKPFRAIAGAEFGAARGDN